MGEGQGGGCRGGRGIISLMEFFFPEDGLQRSSPEETKIISLTAEPYEDGRRVRVNIEMSAFEKRPHLEFTLTDTENQEISTASFVEPMAWKLEFTLHLRTKPADGPLDLEARLFYPDGPEAEPATVRFELPSRT
jgi:hypothetical protein